MVDPAVQSEIHRTLLEYTWNDLDAEEQDNSDEGSFWVCRTVEPVAPTP